MLKHAFDSLTKPNLRHPNIAFGALCLVAGIWATTTAWLALELALWAYDAV